MLPLIAVDLGGTVEDTWTAKRFWFAARGFDIGENPLGRREVVERVGGDEVLYEAMISDVYSDVGIAAHGLTDGCVEALDVIATEFRIVLLSSRPAHQYSITRKWLHSHRIGDLVHDLICIGHSRSKVEWCRAMGAKFIVDDDSRHLEAIGLEEDLLAIHFCAARQPPTCAARVFLEATNWPDVVSIVRSTQRSYKLPNC